MGIVSNQSCVLIQNHCSTQYKETKEGIKRKAFLFCFEFYLNNTLNNNNNINNNIVITIRMFRMEDLLKIYEFGETLGV